jgi:hypothetical protein
MKGTKRFLNVMYIMFFLIISSNLSSQVLKAQDNIPLADKIDENFDTTSLLEVMSSPASEAKDHKCFLYTVEEIKEQLKDKIECYNKDLHLDENKELREIIEAAKVLGRAEGRISKPVLSHDELSLSKEVQYFEKIRGQFNFANSAYDLLSKAKIIGENDFDRIFKGMSEEIDRLSKRNDFATYFVNDLKRLRLYVRRHEELNVLYPKSEKSIPQCLSITEELSVLKQLHDDPSENGFNTKYALKCRPTENSLHIRPEDFEREGLALTFYTTYDYPSVTPGKFTPILLGMQNNVQKFFYGIMQNPQKVGEVYHKLVINNQEFGFRLTTTCTEVGLPLISFQTNPMRGDKFIMYFSYRSITGNMLFEKTFDLSAKHLENLNIGYFHTHAKDFTVYSNYKYTHENVSKVLSALADKSMNLITTNDEKCCKKEMSCDYYSANKERCIHCSPKYLLFEGKCVEKCPVGTYKKNSNCFKCSNMCESCKNKKTCEKCSAKSFLLDESKSSEKPSSRCVANCPSNTMPVNSKCQTCTKNCQICKNETTCAQCSGTLFLFDGKCVESCNEGYFRDYNPRSCKKCHKGCEKCNDFSRCNQCKEDFYLKEGVCVTKCGEKFYGDLASRQCKGCQDAKCQKCDDKGKCLKCVEGAQLDEKNNCQTKCSCGQVNFNNVCVSCTQHEICDICDASNVNICLDCADDYVNYNGECRKTCPDGFYANINSKCIACPENCKTCNKDKCLMCNGGHYLLNDSKCVANCPEGHIPSGRSCIKCTNNNCSKCAENNLGTCTKCYKNKFIKDGDCVKSCDDGYFMRDNKCVKCFQGCAQCKNDLACEKCENGWYIYHDQCKKQVDPGFRVKHPTNQLEKCTTFNCHDCRNDAKICNKCIDPFLLYNNQCYEKCPTGSYRNSERKCLDCDKNCVHCTDLNTCHQCKNPYFLQNGKCKEACDHGYTSIGRVCTACKNPRCKTCSENLNTCTECKLGEYLLNENCHQNCPSGYYADGRKCSPCKYPCETCKDSKTCLTCQNNLEFVSETSTCKEKCKKGFVLPPGKTSSKDCIRCGDENCLKCLSNDIDTCLECHPEIFEKNGKCVEECGEGFYSNNGKCLRCTANCKSCPESPSKCEECNDSFFLKNRNSCVQDCGDGWIKTSSKKCLQCSGNCKKCTEDNLNYCTECYHWQYLHNGRCVGSCPERFWERKANLDNRLTTNECKSCTVNDCAKCSISSNGQICERCVTGFYRYQNKCVRACPLNHINNGVDCIKSNVDNCKDFPHQNPNICHKCQPGYILIHPSLCDTKCPSGHFIDKSNESSPTCKNCITNCQQCNDQKTCLKCNNGFYLQNNSCVSACDQGYRLSGDKCIPCTATCDTDENCATCTETACLTCKWPLYHHPEDKACLKQCPEGYWGDQTWPSKQCRQCLPFCKKCSDGKTCEECEAGRIMTQDGKCADSCPDGSVRRSSDNNCVLCASDKNCKKCNEEELHKCAICKDGFLLHNESQCLEKCPAGFFSRDRRCNKCIDQCHSCKDDKTCDQCRPNYVLFNNQCVPACPTSHYVSAGKCVPCKDSNAQTCTAEKPITCRKDYLLEEGVCRYKCSPSFYQANFTECKPCSKMCVKCENSNQCKACTDGWLVKDGKCVDRCGENYVAVSGHCKSCENGCKQCLSTDPSTCVNCHKSRWLKDGKCYPECGAGFWNDNSSGINKCSPCLENCQRCNNRNTCQMCAAGFFYKDGKCVKSCGEGFFQNINSRTCTKCQVDNCKNCSNHPAICNTCQWPLYKLDNTCVKDCKQEDGFYSKESQSSLECKRCRWPCKTCTDLNTCNSCHGKWFIREKTCVSTCPDGEIPLNGSCQKCKTNFCKTCKNNLSECTRCKPGRYLMPSQSDENVFTCETECSRGLFNKNGVDCSSCPKNCVECHNSDFCVECKPGFVSHQGKCVERCPAYFVERNRNCVKCPDANCQICDNTNLTSCRRCTPGMKLYNEKCVNTCPQGTYIMKVGDIETCTKCVENCIECDNAWTCKVCKHSWKLLNGKCVENCPNGWSNYQNRKCEKCVDPECKTCANNDNQKCTECNNTFALTQKNTCVKDCGIGFWRKSQPTPTCIPCNDSNCIQCNSHNNVCEKCQKGWVVYNNRCISACPVGHSESAEGVCQKCNDWKCQECSSNDPKVCKKCRDGYILHDNQCVNTCPTGTFKNKLNSCQKCPATCADCRSELFCHKCIAPFVLNAEDNQCSDSCGDGEVSVNGKCTPCADKDCDKCSASNLKQCLECKFGHYLHYGKCYKQCPEGHFPEGSFCKPCLDNCSKCTVYNKCDVCKNGFVLQNGECVVKCSSGSVLVNNTCQKCDNLKCQTCALDKKTCTSCLAPNKLHDGDCLPSCEVSQFFDKAKNTCKECQCDCEKCTEKETCEKCIVPKILNQNKQCVDKCENRFYHDATDNKCKPCANSNCLTCDVSNSNICLTCPPETFKLRNRDCVKKCPEGFEVTAEPELMCTPEPPKRTSECKTGFALRDKACYRCRDDNCEICDPNNLTRCRKCKSNKVLYNYQCIDMCPKSHYKSQDSTCEKCPSNCEECDDEGNCKKCLSDFYFNEKSTQCVRCSDNRVIAGKTCETCKVPGCDKCEKGNSKICELCRSDLVLFNNLCEATCKEGYYRQGGSCRYCGDNCLECTSVNNCQTCKFPHILHDGKCVNRCPNYFASVNGKCTRCAGGQCLECSDKDVNECKKCEFPSILHNGKCLTQCPSGHYKKDSDNSCAKCADGCQKCDKERCIQCNHGLKIKDTSCVSNCGNNFYDTGRTCIACSDLNCIKCAPQNKCKTCNKSTFLFKQTGQCKDTCPDGFYANSQTNTCKHCSEGCQKCTSNGKCFTCKKGFYLLEGKCMRTCPVGFTTLSTNCVKCSEKNCLRCEPENPDKCTQCKDSFLYNSRCHKTCPLATFIEGQKCKPCAGTCLECSSEFKCKKCKPEFALLNGECANSCPDGRVKINGVCVSCGDNKCAACSTDINSCLKCKNPYLIYNSKCVSSCPQGFREENNKCVPCPTGCQTCTKEGVCTSCKTGYFFNNNKCRTGCPSGYYPECKTKKCEICDESCEECVDKTSKDCLNCSKNFYKDEKLCVREKECRSGTYADKTTNKCENCKLPYCKQCTDKDTCTRCTKGFSLQKDKCIVGKTFVSVIKGSKIFDKFRPENKNIIPISQLKGTGAGSPHVSFNFWLRLLSPISDNTTNPHKHIISFKRGFSSNTYEYTLYINSFDKKCGFKVTDKNNNRVGNVALDDCDYQKLSRWRFYTVNIVMKTQEFKINIKIRDIHDKLKKYIKFQGKANNDGSITEIVNKDTKIHINDNGKKLAANFQLFNFNLLDYVPSDDDVEEFYKKHPSSCDYFCTNCADTCKMCPEGLPVDGYCKARSVSVAKGLTEIDLDTKKEPINFLLTANVHKTFESDRYGFSTWFYTDMNLDNKEIELYADYYDGDKKNNDVKIKNGQLTVNSSAPTSLFNGKIKPHTWYFIMVGFSKENTTVEVYSIEGEELLSKKNNNPPAKPFIRIWNSSTFKFNIEKGNLYNIEFFLNNIPKKDDLKKLIHDLKCPSHCKTCGKNLTCLKCANGYIKLEDGKCHLDIDVKSPTSKVIDRVDLNDKESIKFADREFTEEEEYSVSFWLRKKTHSYLPSDAFDRKELPRDIKKDSKFNILSVVDINGKTYSLITMKNEEKFKSHFDFFNFDKHSDKSDEEEDEIKPIVDFPHTFNDEIYNFIHVVYIVNKTKNTLTYNIKDFSTNKLYIESEKLSHKVQKAPHDAFILGDKKGFEINMEVFRVQLFNVALNKPSIDKMRQHEPIDCNAGCKTSCDYSTGICDKCASGLQNTKKCPAFLLGYTVSYLYSRSNPHYDTLHDLNDYVNTFSNAGFTNNINSKKYSVIGFFKVFDFENTVNREDVKYRLVTVGNRKKINFKNDASHDILALDLSIKNSNSAILSVIVNMGSEKKTFNLYGLEVTSNHWYAFHAGVDVTNKDLKFKLIDLTNKKQATAVNKLKSFPENLQSSAGISILGVHDNLNDNNQADGKQLTYLVPSVRLQHTYLIPNSDYNEDLFKKFQEKFELPKDPKCEQNCERCLLNKQNKLECITCSRGYVYENGKCQEKSNGPSNSKFDYVVLSDKDVLTGKIPQKFVLQGIKGLDTPNNGGLPVKSTLSFYVRRNYYSNADRKILSYGKIDLYVTKNSTENDSLEIRISGTNLKTKVKLGSKYIWYGVLISANKNVVTLDAISEKQKDGVISASLTLPQNIAGSVMPNGQFTLDSNLSEFQFYGVALALANIKKPIISWPKVDCGIDCTFCQNNTCKVCLYGFRKGKCVSKNLQFPAENTYTSLPLTKFLAPKQPLRSNKYTLYFTIKINASGVVNLFKFNNDKKANNLANPQDHLFLKYNTKTFTFYIGYTTRHGLVSNNSAEIIEAKYEKRPQLSEHFVAFSVEKKKISYFIWNDRHNYIKGEFNVNGFMDYITTNTHLHFFGQKPEKVDTLPGFVDNIRVYYDKALPLTQILEKAISSTGHVQPKVCKEGNRLSCKACADGILVNKLCQPLEHANVLISGEVVPVSRFTAKDTKNHTFTPRSKDSLLKTFTLDFWWRPTALINTPQTLVNLKYTDKTPEDQEQLFWIIFTPQNSLQLGYSSNCDENSKSLIIPDVIRPEEMFKWIHIRVNVDLTAKTQDITIKHDSTKRKIIRRGKIEDSEVPKTGLKLGPQTKLHLSLGPKDTLLGTTDNVSFEVAHLAFITNYLISKDNARKYQTVAPSMNDIPCLKNVKSDVCPIKDRVLRPINIGDHIAGIPNVKKTDNLSYLSKVPLFRPLFANAPYAQSFYYYLLSFQLDVQKYLDSPYKPNRDTLLTIHNNNKPEYDSLSMNDVIPDSLSRTGAISFTVNKGGMKIYNGYNPSTNSVNSFEVPLGGKNINSYKKIYVSLVVDILDKTSRIVVLADELVYSVEISKSEMTSPINFYSLVYTHPVLEKVNLSFFNPRLYNDLDKNVDKHLKSIKKDKDDEKCDFDDANCKVWFIPEETKAVYCLGCKDGFRFYEGSCKPQFVKGN